MKTIKYKIGFVTQHENSCDATVRWPGYYETRVGFTSVAKAKKFISFYVDLKSR